MGTSNAIPPVVHEVLRSPGELLDAATRGFMEPRFGHDFSRVRVHTDAKAAESARAVSALAYTVGRDVVFGAGQYAPTTSRGLGLLTHELAHVVQQSPAPDAPADLELDDARGEPEADAAARAALSGRRAPVAAGAARPSLARFRESKTLPEPDGSKVQIDRVITPGQCGLRPENRTGTAGDVTARQAFIEFDFCRGRAGAHARSELNYGDALDQTRAAASTLAGNLATQRPDQALRTFEGDLRRIAPEGQVRLNFQAPGFRVDLGGTGRASAAEGASGEATGGVAVDIGPMTVGAKGKVQGGTGQSTSVEALLTVSTRDRSRRDRNCFVCACTSPKIEFQCLQFPPPSSPEPPKKAEPVIVPLFFEFEKADPRRGWETKYQEEIQLAVARIREGYTITRIQGNTSPEGPEKPRRLGGFNNVDLAKQRAKKAHDDLQDALRAALVLGMRGGLGPLRAALEAKYPVEGQGELFGSSGGKEVPERDMFRHLRAALPEPSPGADPLAKENVTGEGLPPDVRTEVEAQVKEFRTGRRGERSLTKAESLEAIYKPLRRALIFLQPPPPPPPRLDITPEIAEAIVGTSIDCTEEHRQKAGFPKPPEESTFEGECRTPGERTIDTGRP